MKKDNNIYIVHEGIRYRLIRRSIGCDCIESCSFRKQECEDKVMAVCHLPKWFADLDITDAWLERVDPKVELIKAVGGRVRKYDSHGKAPYKVLPRDNDDYDPIPMGR